MLKVIYLNNVEYNKEKWGTQSKLTSNTQEVIYHVGTGSLETLKPERHEGYTN